jgi:hypothetical protein
MAVGAAANAGYAASKAALNGFVTSVFEVISN